jgi:hypothetical protein
MDSDLNNESNNEYPLYIYIHLFFVFVGFIIYLTGIILFKVFFDNLSLIKNEIFTFILINSFKSFLEILLSSSITKEFIIYLFGIIEFYLVITYINKSLTTTKISENNNQIYELEYRYYIILCFVISSFPYENVVNLSGKYIFSYDTINIILSILFFRYINIKMQLLLDCLKEKKVQNSETTDIYLTYIKAEYYYTQFSIINIIFYATLFFVLIYNVIKILNLFFEWKTLSIYLILIFKEAIYCSIMAGGLMSFISLNIYNYVEPEKRNNESGDDLHLSNSSVIEVEIQQEENTNNSKRKKKGKKKKEKKSNQNEDEDSEKEKENSKISEETETLK